MGSDTGSKMPDIVERLRSVARDMAMDAGPFSDGILPKAEQHLTWVAADEIERLRAEIERHRMWRQRTREAKERAEV